METQPIQIIMDDVALWFLPETETTWYIWKAALRDMRRAVRDSKMSFEWNFVIVSLEPSDSLRRGSLIGRPMTATSASEKT